LGENNFFRALVDKDRELQKMWSKKWKPPCGLHAEVLHPLRCRYSGGGELALTEAARVRLRTRGRELPFGVAGIL
jgi:hypothetical protein